MTDLTARAAALLEEQTELAAEYLADRPLGSFVPIHLLEHAMSGARLNLMEIQDAILDRPEGKSFWVAKKNSRVVGLFIIDRKAMTDYEKVPNP